MPMAVKSTKSLLLMVIIITSPHHKESKAKKDLKVNPVKVISSIARYLTLQ